MLMIRKLALIFGSKTKAQEIILLLKDAKAVVRQGFYENEMPKVEKFCQEHNLFLAKSRFKVILTEEDSYSHKGFRIPETDKRPGLYFVYISKDEEKTWLAAYYELMQNHRELGIILGYPPCCVAYFCKNFNVRNVNPMLKPTNLYTNLSKREKDQVLISHFPCNSDCKQSQQLARKYWYVINEADKTRGKELMEQLRP